MAIIRNLKVHILSGLILSIMVAFVITQYLVSRNTVKTKNNDMMRSFIRHEICAINDWIYEHQQIINLASALFKTDWLDENATQQYLKTFLDSGQNFTSLYFGTPDNRLIAASEWKRPPNFDLRTRPWYLEALRTGGLTTTPVFLNASKDELIITISKPIFNQAGRLVGVVAGDLPLESLLAQIRLASTNKDEETFIVSTDGQLLAHSSIKTNTVPLETKLPHPDYAAVLSDIAHTKTGSLEIELGQTSGFLVFKHVKRLDIIVAAFVPNTLLDTTLSTLTMTFIVIMTISLCLWGYCIWYQRRHIALPWILLTQGLQAINPDVRPWYRLPSIPSKNFSPIIETVNGILDKIERYYDKKNSAELALKKSLSEKETLLREVHHRVKDNMQIIINLLETQAGFQHTPRSIDALNQVVQRLQSMLIVHEELYNSADLSSIVFTPLAARILSSLSKTLDQKQRIQYSIESGETSLNLIAAIPCSLILDELISNAMRHAFPGERGGNIRISLKPISGSISGKRFVLVIEDDGCGLPEGLDLNTAQTVGLQLVSILCKQLQADLALDRSKGTRYTIIF